LLLLHLLKRRRAEKVAIYTHSLHHLPMRLDTHTRIDIEFLDILYFYGCCDVAAARLSDSSSANARRSLCV